MKNFYKILVVVLLYTNLSLPQYSSISIRGPETIRPGTTNLYECYANYNYGGTPTIINNPTWEKIDVNPEFLNYSAFVNWEFNSLKVADFVTGEFEFTLKCTYQSLIATKRITVLASPPELTETKNAYLLWVPSNIKDKSIFTDFAESVLSDKVFKKIIERGLGISSKLAKKFGGFIFSILTSLPSVGPPTVFDLSLLKDGNEKNILNVRTGEEFIFQLKFSSGQNVTWQNGIQIEISKQRGIEKIYNPNKAFDFYTTLELLTPDESQSLRDMADYLIYPNKALAFNQPGVYRIKVLNEADSGTRVVYVQVSGEQVTTGNILLGFILDSSGSMEKTDPYNIRKSATKQIIDILNGNEKVFIVDFDDNAKWINSNNWENWDRDALKNSINTIDSDGGTNIGKGIDKMRIAIQDKLSADTRAAVILLTDGDGKYNNEALWFRDHNIPIYTISYKDKAVSVLMNNIARTTNGLYIKAKNESDIVSAFTQFYNMLLGNGIALHDNGTIMPGEIGRASCRERV